VSPPTAFLTGVVAEGTRKSRCRGRRDRGDVRGCADGVDQRLGVVALAIAANLGLGSARVASGTLARPLGRRVVAALCSALAARGVVWAAADAQGRWPSLTVAVVAAVAGVAVYLVVDRAAGGPGWRRTLATMGSAEVAA
jgi:hypothetical protein